MNNKSIFVPIFLIVLISILGIYHDLVMELIISGGILATVLVFVIQYFIESRKKHPWQETWEHLRKKIKDPQLEGIKIRLDWEISGCMVESQKIHVETSDTSHRFISSDLVEFHRNKLFSIDWKIGFEKRDYYSFNSIKGMHLVGYDRTSMPLKFSEVPLCPKCGGTIKNNDCPNGCIKKWYIDMEKLRKTYPVLDLLWRDGKVRINPSVGVLCNSCDVNLTREQNKCKCDWRKEYPEFMNGK